MTIRDNLVFQADVNTRGRSDNNFYDHVTKTLMTATGSPTVDTGQEVNGLTFNGSTQYCSVALPGAISSTICDSNFTIAVRFRLDSLDTLQTKKVFVLGQATSTKRADIGVDSTADDLIVGAFDAPSGTDEFESGTAATTSAHVVVWRRSGNNFTLWIDGTKTNDVTTAVGTMSTIDQINIARRGGSAASQWYLPGTVWWVAIYNAAIADADIAKLDDRVNPFVPHSLSVATAGSGAATQAGVQRAPVSVADAGSGAATQAGAQRAPVSVDGAGSGAGVQAVIARFAVSVAETGAGTGESDATVAGDLNVTVTTPGSGGHSTDVSLAGDLNVDVTTPATGNAVQSVAARFVISALTPATGADAVAISALMAGSLLEAAQAQANQLVSLRAPVSVGEAGSGASAQSNAPGIQVSVGEAGAGAAALSVGQRAALAAVEAGVAAVLTAAVQRAGVNVSDGAIGAVTVSAVLDSERFELVGDVHLRNRSVVYRVRSIRRRR